MVLPFHSLCHKNFVGDTYHIMIRYKIRLSISLSKLAHQPIIEQYTAPDQSKNVKKLLFNTPVFLNSRQGCDVSHFKEDVNFSETRLKPAASKKTVYRLLLYGRPSQLFRNASHTVPSSFSIRHAKLDDLEVNKGLEVPGDKLVCQILNMPPSKLCLADKEQ